MPRITRCAFAMRRENTGPPAGAKVPSAVRVIVVLDHPATGAELAKIRAWALANYPYTPESSVTRMIYFGGNSLTAGQGSTAGNDYPSKVMSSAELTTNCDYVNAGVSGMKGGDMVNTSPTRDGPAFLGSHAKKVFVCWEIGKRHFPRRDGGASGCQRPVALPAGEGAGRNRVHRPHCAAEVGSQWRQGDGANGRKHGAPRAADSSRRMRCTASWPRSRLTSDAAPP